MLFEVIADDVLLFVHSHADITDAECERLLRFFLQRRDRLRRLRPIILTDGGGPSASQRKVLREEFADEIWAVPMAVVTESVIVHCTVGAISMFAEAIKTFLPAGASKVFDYLGLDAVTTRKVKARIVELSAQVGHGRYKTLDAVAAIFEKR